MFNICLGFAQRPWNLNQIELAWSLFQTNSLLYIDWNCNCKIIFKKQTETELCQVVWNSYSNLKKFKTYIIIAMRLKGSITMGTGSPGHSVAMGTRSPGTRSPGHSVSRALGRWGTRSQGHLVAASRLRLGPTSGGRRPLAWLEYLGLLSRREIPSEETRRLKLMPMMNRGSHTWRSC